MNTRERICERLRDAFDPVHLDVVDESAGHRGRAGAESHFRVTVISEAFCGESLLARHRAVNRCLEDELAGGVHALAINTYTPDEWHAREARTRSTPPCAGANRGSSGNVDAGR